MAKVETHLTCNELDSLFDDIYAFLASIKPKNANTLRIGDWDSSFVGEGFDFEELREYEPGDDMRRIDARASLRLGKSMVVKQVETREVRVLVILDLSPSMMLRDKPKMAYSAANMIFLSALDQYMPAGFLLALQDGQIAVRPKLGNKHLYRFKNMVEKSICNELDLSEEDSAMPQDSLFCLENFGSSVPQGSYVFIISDFLGYNAAHLHSLFDEELWGKRIIPVVVQDDLEFTFPVFDSTGMSVNLVDPETGEAKEVRLNKKTSREIKHEHEMRFVKLQEVFSEENLTSMHVAKHDLQAMFDTLQDALQEERMKRK